MRNPSSISLMITALDSSNRRLSWSLQLNGVLGFSSWRNGGILSAEAKAYDTWFMRPNQDRMSVMFWGAGKSRIASRYFVHGLTLLRVISKPANSTMSWPNTNFPGWSVMPFLPQTSSHSTAWWKLCSKLSAQSSVSSMHLVLSGCQTQSRQISVCTHHQRQCNLEEQFYIGIYPRV